MQGRGSVLALDNVVKTINAKVAMLAMTTSNSIIVKAVRRYGLFAKPLFK